MGGPSVAQQQGLWVFGVGAALRAVCGLLAALRAVCGLLAALER